ncbi:MAG: SDR family oxidoreductase, partial [Pseudomonadota bacterium]
QASEAFGAPVSVLINSASSFMADTFGTVTGESWRFLMDVNAAAPVFLMQAFGAQNPTPTGGAIVNILDAQMTSASPDRVSYFCSKFALEGATRLAAYDFATRKIRVNAIAPGIILPSEQTQEEFELRQSQTPLGQGLGPDDIVEAVRYLVAAKHVTGHILAVDAGERLMGYGNAPFAADRG